MTELAAQAILKFSQNFAPIWHNQIDRMVQTQDVARRASHEVRFV
jgi:hypothetical protein